jgi:glycosyltransferase involved in cell wall biosynthesis
MAMRERMRVAARRRAAERYRWDEVTSAYEAFFSELMR